MRRICHALAFACVVNATMAATPAPPTITSRAALNRYLRETPAGQSPLDALSPEARKRFLAQLNFGEHGVRGFGFEDLQESLTDAQIRPILSLFNLTEFSASLHGLAAADAPACRGAAPCPSSTIDKAYTALRDPAHQRDGAYAAHVYATTFAPFQSSAALTRASNGDLRLLFRASDFTANTSELTTPLPTVMADMRRDLDELHRRGLDRNQDWQSMQDLYVSDRQFDAARELSAHHPGLMTVPPLADIPDAHGPTMLTVDPSGSLRREVYDTRHTSARIVVVAGCHFAADAARQIEEEASLAPAFQRHALWLAPQGESIDEVRAWNAEHAGQPIHVAWRNSEWPMLDSWAMPTFYVFRDGQLLGKVTGYQPEPLRDLLHRASLTD